MTAPSASDKSSLVPALARAAANTDWNELPTEIREMGIDLFLDALSVIAAGSLHPDMNRLVGQVTPASGPATLIGTGSGVTMRDAVLLNAANITVLQLQDGHAIAKGHPASQLLPVVLAIAERNGADAIALLSAFVAGYEVGARVGIALGGVLPWLHDTGNWATLGAATAAAHLLSDADDTVIEHTIDGAASLGLFFDRFTTVEGATLHHLYPALATTHALAVAEGAAAGLTPRAGSLIDFYGPRLGEAFEPDLLVQGIEAERWTRFELLNGYFKLHPSCAHLHGVNDAIADLIATHNISEVDVAAVEVETFGPAMEIDSHAPCNDLAARFSAGATVAAALRHGRLDERGLQDLAGLAPLMQKIRVRHDPDLDAYAPEGRPGRVKVQLNDGRTLTREVIYPRGTPAAPAGRDERHTKARDLLQRRYGPEGAARIIATVLALGEGGDVSELSVALRQSQPV
jgi:2-methylcitrate dehydratase PrpD